MPIFKVNEPNMGWWAAMLGGGVGVVGGWEEDVWYFGSLVVGVCAHTKKNTQAHRATQQCQRTTVLVVDHHDLLVVGAVAPGPLRDRQCQLQEGLRREYLRDSAG